MVMLSVSDEVMGEWMHHRGKWVGCTRCGLGAKARNVVLVRGELPCDILFILEAPGPSENVMGWPVVGPSREVLDGAVERSGCTKYSYAVANVLGCIPRAEDGSTGIRKPRKEEVEACRPRLEELLRIGAPRAVVLMGEEAKRWVPFRMLGDVEFVAKTLHPAFVLRQMRGKRESGDAFRWNVEFKRIVQVLKEVCNELGG